MAYNTGDTTMKTLITLTLVTLLTGCAAGRGGNNQALSEALFRASDQALRYSQPQQQYQPRNISCMPVGNHVTCNQW